MMVLTPINGNLPLMDNSWQNIGEYNSTYTITAFDIGNKIRAQISYTDNKGFKEKVVQMLARSQFQSLLIMWKLMGLILSLKMTMVMAISLQQVQMISFP